VGGGVRLHFADGSTATASAVIGCDGIKSKTRGYLFNHKVNPEYTGEYGYRALVPEKLAREILGDDIALNGQLYVGYGGFIITYPVEHGKLINMVSVVQSRRNPVSIRSIRYARSYHIISYQSIFFGSTTK
jgi:salicylate hydroxylase